MQAVVFARNAGPEVPEYKEVPDPTARKGQVLVNYIETAGVNYGGAYEREGHGLYSANPPAVIGVDGAGTVAGTGDCQVLVALHEDNPRPNFRSNTRTRTVCASKYPEVVADVIVQALGMTEVEALRKAD